MTLGVVVAFWAVSILFVITPGADWAYAISAGMHGRSAPAIIGLLMGHLAATVLVAAGVGTVVAGTPLALRLLTVAGAFYLLKLGIDMLVRPPVLGLVSAETDQSPSRRWVAKGFGVSGLNPKVFLLFLTLLPQFTDPASRWPIAAQMTMLGLVHVASCCVVYSLVAYGSRAVLRARPTVARWVGRVSGAAMASVALLLLAEQVAQ